MQTIKDINLTKKEQERLIIGKIKLYGYAYGKEPMKVDRTLFETAKVLMCIPEISQIPVTQELEITNSLQETATNFFNQFFSVHHIRFISIDEFQKIAIKYCSEQKPEILIKLCEELEQYSEMIPPFELPITYIPSETVMSGITQKPIFLKNNDKYLKRQDIYFSGIALGQQVTNITPYTYIHEITHTQVESVKGAVKDYHNSEVLPILLELIAAYETDKTQKKLSFIIKVRLRDTFEKMALLYQGINDLNSMLNNTIYVKSTLQALALFDIYYSNSKETKQKMIEDIQQIFDGHQTLERFMMNYKVDFQKSAAPEQIKKYKKTYL